MSKRFIVVIGREFGSGGKHIGRAIAEQLGVELYDRNVIEKVADELNVNADELEEYASRKRNFLFSRSVKGYSSSLEDNVAQMQFDYIRRLGESDESFVIVGRCAEEILRDCEGVITIFVKGEREYKIKRVMEQFRLSRCDAIEKMERHDRTRKYYHDRFCRGKWGLIETYDLCIDSSHFGTQRTAELLVKYIKYRIDEQ